MKNTNSVKSDSPRKRSHENLHTRIARHALELWNRYGQPIGREAEVWLEAADDLLCQEDHLPARRSPTMRQSHA